VVGHFVDDLGDERALYWSAARGMIALPGLTGTESDALAINSAGRIAGDADIDTGDAHAVVWTRTGNPPSSPEEQIQDLTTSVNALVTAGHLKPGQANGLIRPLNNALKSLANGRVNAACGQLADFQAEVDAKVAGGALLAAEGDALVAEAEAIRTAIGC
jgi:hypothetical protein